MYLELVIHVWREGAKNCSIPLNRNDVALRDTNLVGYIFTFWNAYEQPSSTARCKFTFVGNVLLSSNIIL